ncbi:MAG: hypothetical protein IPK82_00370 [Polyangiaceae bacterium]|nr:hypothetical protein [Polyangiaceae bacterium]
MWCLAVSALAVTVFWPSKSFAAIVQACESDFATRLAESVAGETRSDDCSSDDADDIDNSRAAPICDSRGISAVAPPRIRGVADVRLDRNKPCDSGESARQMVTSDRSDPPGHSPEALAERAILPEITLAPRTADERIIDPPAVTFGPAAGVRTDVFHPPR